LETLAVKVPSRTAAVIRRKARARGQTTSQYLRNLIEEDHYPTSEVWAPELLKIAGKGRTRRHTRPASVDPLTWAIDTGA
jgi:hypothetical protein